jgi:hypothetical protein
MQSYLKYGVIFKTITAGFMTCSRLPQDEIFIIHSHSQRFWLASKFGSGDRAGNMSLASLYHFSD